MPAPDPPDAESVAYEAELASGPSGAVHYGAPLTDAEAIARRRGGLNVVVRGNVATNGTKARQIEEAVGPCKRHPPHNRAGKDALPHYQQESGSPSEHTFYEIGERRARRKR
jgi:hypothetical protein